MRKDLEIQDRHVSNLSEENTSSFAQKALLIEDTKEHTS
ncbi:hypothetical protein PMI16_01236 [Herbaspirillum sp. CF444]|nr:hypothetical protein PMI16_01236 [Herbaspirillum sp. CF444]